jgi:hypothetical protein
LINTPLFLSSLPFAFKNGIWLSRLGRLIFANCNDGGIAPFTNLVPWDQPHPDDAILMMAVI